MSDATSPVQPDPAIDPTSHDAPARAAATPPDVDAAGGTSRLGNVAWILCSTLIVVLVLAFWLRVHDEQAGQNLAAQIADKERPAAPALPTKGIAGDGSPGLPSWYRAASGHQARVAAAQPIVVNWWASWCGPCVDEAPILRTVSKDYAGRVTFVGLNPGPEDLESDARAFVRDHRLTFSIVRGTKADNDAWGVHQYPETFIVGADGRLSAHIKGPVEEDELRALLDSELAKDRATT
jgi:cytochrome c biogenesis protein CcmG/thiol:disulfide interchange protein DsbE